MARALGLEYAGALYHITSRGDRLESIKRLRNISVFGYLCRTVVLEKGAMTSVFYLDIRRVCVYSYLYLMVGLPTVIFILCYRSLSSCCSK
jgi:hypothetical protein